VSFQRPSIDTVVAPLVATLRSMAPLDADGRALGIELWADRMASTVYGPDSMPRDFYTELADGLEASADGDARPALAALARVLTWREARPLRHVHQRLRAAAGDDDASDLGIGRATPLRAVEVSHVQGDGVSLIIDFDQPTAAHTVGVYVDHNLLGMAKDLFVGPAWSILEDSGAYRGDDGDDGAGGGGMVRAEITLADARARIEAALRSTDHSPGAPVSEDFEASRPLVERRLALLPIGGREPLPVELDEDVIPGLIDAFLASPEALELDEAEREEAAWTVELWLDHATSETIGGPLRLSPTLVELFCADWYPRMVGADSATAAAAPAVLEAWARYAARTSGLGKRWLDEALRAIGHWGPEMRRALGPEADLPGFPGLPDPRPSHLSAVADDPGRTSGPAVAGVHLDPEELELLSWVGAQEEADRVAEVWGDGPALPPVESTVWKPLQSFIGSGPVPWDVDDSRVKPEVATKVNAICLRCAHIGAALLGPAFVPAAVEVAVRIGQVEPSPLPHTQDRAWTAAILWLLVEDSGGFEPSTAGRTHDDLVGELGLNRDTITRRVAEIRDLLDLSEGDYAVSW